MFNGLFRRSKPSPAGRALILGCGPAGLFAAHALAEAGWEFDIWSKKRPSELYGAQYLHAPIPGLDSERRELTYTLWGSSPQYREKVYGGNWSDIPVSPDRLKPEHHAYDIREAYRQAWNLYVDRIEDRPEISFNSLVRDDLSEYDLLISSIPAKALCVGGHQFRSVDVWAIGDAPERDKTCPIRVAAPMEVICNGASNPSWYRNSNVFGHYTAEWPINAKPPLISVARLTKPISTNCDCLERLPALQYNLRNGLRVMRVGRYGKWKKNALAHHAYYDTAELLQEAKRWPRTTVKS